MNMRIVRVKLLIVLLLLAGGSFGQIVKGYFPYYRSAADVSAIQYNKLTDIIYAFAAIDANGNLLIMGPGGTPDLSLFNSLKTNCASNGVRLWIAIGGWGLSGNFSGVAGNATRRATLANACLNLCTTHGLAGIDIDWEFPGAGDAANYTQMLADIKGVLGTTYKLSAALGGESFNYSCVASGHAVGVQAAAFTHLDYFNIMSYDAPTCFANHSSLDFLQRSMTGWNAKGCPYSKMVVGMAFYSRGSMVEMWKNIATTTRFNDADGIDGSLNFDSKPTIEAKINYAICTMGAAGAMTWELSQDLPGANSLNLTTVMKDAVDACSCPFTDPNLGADQSLCGVGSIVLNSGVSTASGRTFSWTRNGSSFAGTGPTNTVTLAGTYVVTITQGTCTKDDEIIITASLPTPDLGTNKTICDPASYNLVPSNLASFPGTSTWQWRKDGSDITGAISSTLSNVRTTGTYRLTASISGCSSTFDEVALTSSLPTPVDGCNASAPIALSITNASGGPYTWHSDPTTSTVLTTGTSYNAPGTGTYYVQDGVAAPPYYVGLAGPANSFQNPTGTSIGLNFTTSATVTINSVDVFVPTGASGNVQIKIRNSANTADVITGPLTPVTNSTGAMLKVTVPVGGSLPAGSYKMIDVGTLNLHVNSAPTYPLTNASVSITGSFGLGSYAYFFNWEIAGSGSACKRLPVVASVNGSCTSAPVELIHFTAQTKENKVFLNWSTIQEINNDFFQVERSSDGINFIAIETVEGNGNSNTLREYSITDPTFLSGKVYYRLAQYDFDGTVHYSPVVSLDFTSATISINPNPFSYTTNLLIQSSQPTAELQWFDMQGRSFGRFILKTGEVQTIGEELVSGIYILEIITDETIHRQKIIKD
jgi:GH18 family chitinase